MKSIVFEFVTTRIHLFISHEASCINPNPQTKFCLIALQSVMSFPQTQQKKVFAL